VTGATGTVGRLVVAGLRERRVACRAMVRDLARGRAILPGVDLVQGDFEDGASLERAFRGADTMFLLNAPGVHIPAHDLRAIEMAERAGVEKIVKVSGASALTKSSIGEWHQPGEAALARSELRWTVLRPSSFASNALRWAGPIRAGKPVPIATGDGKQGVIDPRDIAEAAVAALLSRELHGKCIPLSGPELLSSPEQVEILARLLGRPVPVAHVTLEAVRDQMLSSGAAEPFVDAVTEAFSYMRAGRAAVLYQAASKMLGRPPRSFEQWARDHLSSFTAA